ncbi:hypothetical protein DL93DRAFT_2070001 [Clavulina sp. PMI_390]|nr:hypothetical protein DL93DRAFT_2070001 [Clavulina sp. PMI_390]
MSSAPATSNDKPADTTEKASTTDLPQLGALEEDDEFEEFPAQDWDDSEADLSHLVSGTTGSNTTPETFWEENWDDDDIEDDFSKQLREELAKAGATSAPDATMSNP